VMKQYIIRRIFDEGPICLENFPSVSLDSFPWDENGYRPITLAVIGWAEDGLHVRMQACEAEIKAEGRCFGDPVHADSCMEFFMMPCPGIDSRFIGFEVNPLGTLYIGIMTCRADHVRFVDCDPAIFHIKTNVTAEELPGYTGSFWEISYIIPIAFINRHFPEFKLYSGLSFRGNFYKCGDNTRYEHYGCWCTPECDHPEFLLSEFFGEFILE